MDSGSQFPLIDILVKHNVPYVIVGGHAVVFHGYLRSTEDIDVLFLRNQDSESALAQALQELDAYWISNEIDPTTKLERIYPVTLEFVKSNHLMMVTTKFGFLDIFDYVPGLPETPMQQLMNEAIVVGNYRYVSLHWLRKMKGAAGRKKDLLDLENLPSSD
ncbi:MAG: hypothetical protein ACI9G1_002323 [Pirellulaceae bacterium]|jgi:hypothetical protein